MTGGPYIMRDEAKLQAEFLEEIEQYVQPYGVEDSCQKSDRVHYTMEDGRIVVVSVEVLE